MKKRQEFYADSYYYTGMRYIRLFEQVLDEFGHKTLMTLMRTLTEQERRQIDIGYDRLLHNPKEATRGIIPKKDWRLRYLPVNKS